MAEPKSPKPAPSNPLDSGAKHNFSFVPSLDKLPPGVHVVVLPCPGDGDSMSLRSALPACVSRSATMRLWGMIPIASGGHVGQYLGAISPRAAAGELGPLEGVLIDECVGMAALVVEMGSGASEEDGAVG